MSQRNHIFVHIHNESLYRTKANLNRWFYMFVTFFDCSKTCLFSIVFLFCLSFVFKQRRKQERSKKNSMYISILWTLQRRKKKPSKMSKNESIAKTEKRLVIFVTRWCLLIDQHIENYSLAHDICMFWMRCWCSLLAAYHTLVRTYIYIHPSI